MYTYSKVNHIGWSCFRRPKILEKLSRILSNKIKKKAKVKNKSKNLKIKENVKKKTKHKRVRVQNQITYVSIQKSEYSMVCTYVIYSCSWYVWYV